MFCIRAQFTFHLCGTYANSCEACTNNVFSCCFSPSLTLYLYLYLYQSLSLSLYIYIYTYIPQSVFTLEGFWRSSCVLVKNRWGQNALTFARFVCVLHTIVTPALVSSTRGGRFFLIIFIVFYNTKCTSAAQIAPWSPQGHPSLQRAPRESPEGSQRAPRELPGESPECSESKIP